MDADEKRRRRIRQIDEEMKMRINELHSLMNKGGLTESVKTLQDKFQIQKQTTKEKSKLMNEEIEDNVGELENNNTNAVVRVNVIPDGRVSQNSRSEETVYKNAVEKRTSTSSEEFDTSEEIEANKLIDELLISERIKSVVNKPGERRSILPDPQPSTSREYEKEEQTKGRGDGEHAIGSPKQLTDAARAAQIVKDAERSKAKIFATTGNNHFQEMDLQNQYVHSAIADDNYMVVGGHIEESIYEKIIKGDYVDFSKLLPRDRVISEEDCRMNLVMRGGRSFWVPVNEGIQISNFSRWEQAFRVFSNIYTKAFPHRSSELIQYNHIVHTISLSYTWENVYSYDREFRLHMSKNPNQVGYAPGYERKKNAEPCRRFNRGKCNFGPTCKFDHKCSYCFKFGHGSVNCRKAQNDRGNRNGGERRDSNQVPNQGNHAMSGNNVGNGASASHATEK